jgi:hypothetical protein
MISEQLRQEPVVASVDSDTKDGWAEWGNKPLIP